MAEKNSYAGIKSGDDVRNRIGLYTQYIQSSANQDSINEAEQLVQAINEYVESSVRQEGERKDRREKHRMMKEIKRYQELLKECDEMDDSLSESRILRKKHRRLKREHKQLNFRYDQMEGLFLENRETSKKLTKALKKGDRRIRELEAELELHPEN